MLLFLIALLHFSAIAFSASVTSSSSIANRIESFNKTHLQTADSQSIAMIALVNAWGRWDVSVDVNTNPCNWSGVSCVNGVVRYLELYSRNFGGIRKTNHKNKIIHI